MLQKTAQIKLTQRHLLFAKLKYEDKLTDEQIAEVCNISRRTVYEWIKRPEIIAEVERLGRADTEKAVRFFQRNSLRAAQATVKLTETRPVKDKRGKVIGQEFIQPGEVVRKAAADILQALKIDVKGSGELREGTSNVVVYLPHNNRDKDAEEEGGR